MFYFNNFYVTICFISDVRLTYNAVVCLLSDTNKIDFLSVSPSHAKIDNRNDIAVIKFPCIYIFDNKFPIMPSIAH